jgi:hypothetical protein
MGTEPLPSGFGWDLTQLWCHLLELSSAMSDEMELIAAAGSSRLPS